MLKRKIYKVGKFFYLWGRNILLALDQLLNAILLGDPDEYLSSRCAKRKAKICKMLCRALHWFDKNHCEESLEKDEGKDGLI